MLGYGVYFGEVDKAASNSGRVLGGVAGNGAIVSAQVRLGVCKVVTHFSEGTCSCGCGMRYSDHLGAWHHKQHYDSIYLTPGAGVKRKEWCVFQLGSATSITRSHSVALLDNRTVDAIVSF